MFCGSVESQYLVGSLSPFGHSISSHSSARSSARHSSRCATRTRRRAKRERSGSAAPSRHAIVRHACRGRLTPAPRPRPADACHRVAAVSAASAARPRFCRQRPRAWRPYRGRRQNAGRIGQAQRRDVGAQVAVIAIAGIQQSHAARPAAAQAQRSCSRAISGLVFERDLLRNARGRDRAMPLDRRQDHLPHLRQHPFVQPAARAVWRPRDALVALAILLLAMVLVVTAFCLISGLGLTRAWPLALLLLMAGLPLVITWGLARQ